MKDLLSGQWRDLLQGHGILGPDGSGHRGWRKAGLDFKAKRAVAKPKLDKAERSLRWSRSQQKRTGLSLRVWSLTWSTRWHADRSGLDPALRWPTILPSFSLQKWVKNEEEARWSSTWSKKNSSRRRGNIEMNNFTRCGLDYECPRHPGSRPLYP